MSADIRVTPAVDEDMRDIWEWRNHPDIRRCFFNTVPVSWEEHQQWFHQKVSDPLSRIYVARSAEGAKIGVIRFEPEGDGAQVSVHLNPAFLGHGLGAGVIRAGTERFQTDVRPQRVVAKIIKGNAASMKAFAKAGYQCFSEEGDALLFRYPAGC